MGTLPGRLTAVLTLAATGLGVLFLLVPSLRPLSRDQIDASLTVPTVETGVTELDWAARQYPTDTLGELRKLIGRPFNPKTDGVVPGMVVYVGLKTDGFQHRTIALRARVYDVRTRRPEPNSDFSTILPKAGVRRIDAPSRSSVQLLFLDDVSSLGRYFVRVEAYDDGGILAYADSAPIPRSAAQTSS